MRIDALFLRPKRSPKFREFWLSYGFNNYNIFNNWVSGLSILMVKMYYNYSNFEFKIDHIIYYIWYDNIDVILKF